MVAETEIDPRPALDALSDATAAELWSFSRLLDLAGGPFGEFANPLKHLAILRGDEVEPDWLCELSMRRALRRLRLLLDADEAARSRLEAAQEPFWVAVQDAVAVAAQ